ncbi:hypothetical protein GCM10023339_76180 [Alloalcanivorax gelatiniphagus]
MKTIVRALSPLTIIAVLAALSTGTAHAAVRDYEDVRGEARTDMDLHSVRLTSTGRWLTVRTKHLDVRPAPRAGGSIAIFIDVDRAHKGPEYAFVGGTSRGTDYALVHTDGWDLADRIHEAELDMDVDYDRDTVRVRMARASMGDPQLVRIAVRSEGPRPNGKPATDWLRTIQHLTPWVTLDTDG